VTKIVSIILGGGRGQRLYPLTAKRAKPAVPFGGKFRLVDIPISNCIHAGLREIYILTQFNSASLHRHINNTYRFDTFSKGFVEVLAAEQTLQSSDWYRAPRTRCGKTSSTSRTSRQRITSSCPATSSTAWTSWRCSRRTSNPERT
jgi:glucose-1-phosphate adenylyltransferase